MDKTAGIRLTEIKNREFIQLTTVNAEKIILGLDLSDIPFFAKYNSMHLSLAFDGSCGDSVTEVIGKAESGKYEEIEQEYLHDKVKSYERLLPEISEILNISVAQIVASKILTDRLVKVYIKNWLADSDTIRRKLGQIIDFDYSKKYKIQY